jgi:peptide methionine sulfoxide reductase msrA/msrB
MLLKTASLTPTALTIIRDKSTEYPGTGRYEKSTSSGTYLCRQCGLALFRSTNKFLSSCGWPSFDDEIANAICQTTDPNGRRTEITCRRCLGHLGHIFLGEGFTKNNKRYCVNSSSIDFVASLTVLDTAEAIFAAGCFWGVEYYFQKFAGVLKTEVGYSGGEEATPTYEMICTKQTSHYEVIRVIYDIAIINFTDLVKYFFEIHNPAQTNGQGPDLGHQYLSRIFYYSAEQKAIATDVAARLKLQGEKVATEILPVKIFWPAEEYHQNYYTKNTQIPYCHFYTKKF